MPTFQISRHQTVHVTRQFWAWVVRVIIMRLLHEISVSAINVFQCWIVVLDFISMTLWSWGSHTLQQRDALWIWLGFRQGIPWSARLRWLRIQTYFRFSSHVGLCTFSVHLCGWLRSDVCRGVRHEVSAMLHSYNSDLCINEFEVRVAVWLCIIAIDNYSFWIEPSTSKQAFIWIDGCQEREKRVRNCSQIGWSPYASIIMVGILHPLLASNRERYSVGQCI